MSTKAFYFRPDQRELLVSVLMTCKIRLQPKESVVPNETALMAMKFTGNRIDELIAYLQKGATP